MAAPIVALQESLNQVRSMASRALQVDKLTAEERIELMGRLWDSLDPATAAPITAALAAELDRRELEADSDPEAGDSWSEIKKGLTKKPR
jgi:putative addiction module component (TIGR02574 family)